MNGEPRGHRGRALHDPAVNQIEIGVRCPSMGPSLSLLLCPLSEHLPVQTAIATLRPAKWVIWKVER